MNELISILPYAAPVAFAAQGELVIEQAGMFNIGLEGMMLFAAYGAYVGDSIGHGAWALFIALLLAILLAQAASALSALFTIRLAIDQVVVGTAINLLAVGVTSTLYRAGVGHAGKLISIPSLPRYGGFDVLLVLLVLCVPLIWWILQRSAWGLAVRATGGLPAAVEAAGLSPNRIRFQASIVSGLFAGLAGAYLVIGTTGSFAENMTSGRGFVAIALVTFGRLKPGWVFASALLIGYLDALQFKLQGWGVAFPRELILGLPYAAALVILVIVGKGGRKRPEPAAP